MYLTPAETSDRHLSSCAPLIVEIHIDKNVQRNKPKTFANKFPNFCVASNFIPLEHTYETEDSRKYLKNTAICKYSPGDVCVFGVSGEVWFS